MASEADESIPLPKKFINEPADVVSEMLDGLCAAYNHLARLPSYNVSDRLVEM